jgi:hypothetical protein
MVGTDVRGMEGANAATLALQDINEGGRIQFWRSDTFNGVGDADSTASAAGARGQIIFGNRNYEDEVVAIRGYVHSTSASAGNYGGFLSFYTEEAGGALGERLRIASNGKTYLSKDLTVSGGYIAFRNTAGTLAGYVGDGSNLAFGDADDLCIRGVDSIKFTTHDGQRDAMTINSDGIVAITGSLGVGGFGGQTAKLAVIGPSAAMAGIWAETNSAYGTPLVLHDTRADASLEYLMQFRRNTNLMGWIGTNATDLTIKTANSLILNPSGGVGIGTLHKAGTMLSVDGDVGISGQLRVQTAAGGGYAASASADELVMVSPALELPSITSSSADALAAYPPPAAV